MNSKVMVSILAAAISSAASATSVQSVVVRQQWPWSNKVNIDYVLVDAANGGHDVTVTIRDGANPVEIAPGSLSGDLYGVMPGERRIVWDPSYGGVERPKMYTSLTATVSVGDDSKMWMIVDLSAGASAGSFPISFTNAPPSGGWNQDVYKTTKLVLRRIKASTFVMGMTEAEIAHFGNPPYYDVPANVCKRHRTTLTQDYYIGVFPVTCGHAYQIDGYTGAYSASTHGQYPAYNTCYAYLRGTNSWDAANWPGLDEASFLGRLNAKTPAVGSELPGYKFDLPSHAQWECACRAGTDTCWNDGSSWAEGGTAATDANLDNLAVYKKSGPDKVGKKTPNAFGIFDMHGLFFERIRDRYSVYYANHSGADETDPLIYSGTAASWSWATWSCGGAWNSDAKICQSSYMQASGSVTDHTSDYMYGFRLAVVPKLAGE